MRSDRSKERIVIFGHAAYCRTEPCCIIPDNTTLTLYSAPGAFLDMPVAAALANGEVVRAVDLEINRADWYLLKHGMPIPEYSDVPELYQYPKTFTANESLPNFLIYPERIRYKEKKYSPVPTRAVTPEYGSNLTEMLKLYAGQDLHWGACTFAKQPDAVSIGYGYEYRLNADSPLKSYYRIEVSEQAQTQQNARSSTTAKKESDQLTGTTVQHGNFFARSVREYRSSSANDSDEYCRPNSHRYRYRPY